MKGWARENRPPGGSRKACLFFEEMNSDYLFLMNVRIQYFLHANPACLAFETKFGIDSKHGGVCRTVPCLDCIVAMFPCKFDYFRFHCNCNASATIISSNPSIVL